MEYVAGATLRDVLRQRGRLNPGEALAVMDHVLAALGAAHNAGLVHRDVKPENVLVTADGRVKVADFGLARAMAGTTLTTDDGMMFGTAAYVAPEQVRDGMSDARSDVYSAGVLLFELLTGTTPFTGDSPLSVAYKHMSDDVPAPSSRVGGIPPELDALVRSATSRDPAARPADGRALHAALVKVRDDLGLHAAVPVPQSTTGVDLTQQLVRPGEATVATTATTVAERTTAALPPVLPPGTETDTDEPERRRRKWPFVVAAIVLLAAIGGAGGWWLAVGRYTHAPSVLNKTKPVAIEQLDKVGLHAKWLHSIYSDTVQRGLVATQSPGPGDRVHKGATITLRLSLGPEEQAVPDVRGKTLEQAKAALKQAHLKYGGKTTAYSDTVPEGHVIRTDPKVGTRLHVENEVKLVLSKGVRPVKVPDVSGLPQGRAKQELEAAGFTVKSVQDYSDTTPEGDVITTEPAPGTFVAPGSALTLVVSKGPHLYPVPDVTGDDVEDARATLESAGFNVKTHAFPGGPGTVLKQNPPGGSMQKHGTTVTLFVF
jgi:serine/threonine-protein kinase